MRPGLTISCVAHAGVLLWGLVAFAAKPSDAPPVEALPVEFISASQFSQLTAGVKNAPKVVEKPMPLADKVGAPKPVKELAPKVADKPEITTDAAVPPPRPRPEPKPESKPEPKPETKAETKPEPKPEAKPEAKPVDKAEKPKPLDKPDRIAEELKKEEVKKPKPEKPKAPAFRPDQIAEELKKVDAKKSEEKPRKEVRSKFDANQVAALLDKRDPQRQLALAETLNGTATLGTATGHAASLSMSELDALRAKLISLWNPPPAVSSHPDQYVVTIRIRLTRDYKLVGQPVVLTSGDGALFEATRDSAVRAVFQAQPYDMLSQATYDQWKEMDINFDPREVFGG